MERTSPRALAPEALRIRRPEARDGAAVHGCVRRWGGLDVNSAYAYLLLCDRFARHCALAEHDGALAGFVMGVPPGDRADTLFVWQVAVAPEARGQGLGVRLIDSVLERVGARYLEAHVGAHNRASDALFARIAERHGAPIHRELAYPAEWFPEAHDKERLVRIGPLER